ncbi:phage major capsid protein [Clostridium disporicum]|uniref:Phage major capsid protein, HK97 family n=1 Tax=Clostridium disporicum TaxID=84024 RepID=A0A174DQP5_9CLOT|nr:phage major capsid protein [Clostridium disporicum]CUO26579.1 phage major capsid protein%2C HK97 family [Clostridium disporicum]
MSFNKRKKLIEQRNSILCEIDELVKTPLLENRGLNQLENARVEALRSKQKELDKEIQELREEARNGAKVTKEKGEIRNMEQNKGLEIRSIVNTGAAQDVIPTGIASEVIKKITENSAIINEMNVIQYEGEFKIAREDAAQEALLLSENEEIPDTELSNRTTVTLKDKRIGSLIKVSKMTLDNAPAIGQDYLINTLSRRLQRTLDKMAFLADGQGNNMTSGILKDGVKLSASAITTDALIEMVTSMEEVYLQGAKWYMTRELYQEVNKLKFEDGKPVLFMDVRNDRPTPVLFGLPVIISEYAEKICLVNPSMALTLKIAPEFGQVTVLREKFITENVYGFLISAFGDIAVTNPAATRVLEIAGRARTK